MRPRADFVCCIRHQPGTIATTALSPEEDVDCESDQYRAEPDLWDRILSEPPRSSFLEYVKQVEREIAEGRTEPLDLSKF